MFDRYEFEILNKWGDSETYVDFLLTDKKLGKIGHFCNWYDGDIELTDNEILEDLHSNPDKWFELPKTSSISKTMYDIFKDICESENDMLFIEDEDDFERYNINPKTYPRLCKEINKLKLNNYFDIKSEMIIVYGGLQCAFNDDRNLINSNDKINYVSKEFINENFDLFNKKNNSELQLVIFQDNGKYIAIDDSNGDCYIEEFDELGQANLWLLNKELTKEDILKMKIPNYINKFIKELEPLSKEESYEL